MCVDAGSCSPANQLSQCTGDVSGPTPPPSFGSTQYVTAAPFGGETVAVPGSQSGGGGGKRSSGPSTTVIAGVIGALLLLIALVVCVARKRRRNGMLLAVPPPANPVAARGDSATQLRFYGDAPARVRSGANVHRSRGASRAVSRSHLRQSPTTPLTYGPGPAGSVAAPSWASSSYGGAQDGRYQQVADEYAPVPSPQAAYRDLSMGASYQSLSMKQSAAQYHTPPAEITPAPTAPYMHASYAAARGTPPSGYVNLVRPSPGTTQVQPVRPPGPARGGATHSAYASTASSTYSATAMQPMPTRSVQSETYDLMYTPVP